MGQNGKDHRLGSMRGQGFVPVTSTQKLSYLRQVA